MDILTWAIRTAGMANARDASKMRIVPMAGCGVGMAARMTRLGEDFLELTGCRLCTCAHPDKCCTKGSLHNEHRDTRDKHAKKPSNHRIRCNCARRVVTAAVYSRFHNSIK